MSKKSIAILAAAVVLIAVIVIGFIIPRGVEDAAEVEEPAKEAERPVEQPAAEDELYTPVGTFPIVNEPITMRVFAPDHPFVENLNTNLETKWMEEKTGIQIEWLMAPVEGAAERVMLMLAAADLPDVFMIPGTITNDMVVRFGVEAGMFLPLNDLIETQMVNFPKHMEKYGFRGAITAVDGNIYGLPGWNDCFHCQYAQRFVMNHAWLDSLGLQPPETTEELYQVLKAFRDNDPNGNGIADEIPLTGTPDTWHADVVNFIMNAFIFDSGMYEPTRTFLNVGEGRIDTIVNKDQYREGLKFLNRLYKEGLLYPPSFTQSLDELRALGAANIVGSASGGFAGLWLDPVAQEDLYRQFKFLDPLEGPDGTRQTPWFRYQPLRHNEFIITKVAEHPEAFIRWADYRLNMENYLEMEKGIGRFGLPESGAVGINGKPALYRRLIPWTEEVQNVFWFEGGLTFLTSDYRLGEQADPDMDRFSPAGLEVLLFEASRDLMQPSTSQDYETLPPLQHLVAESEEIAVLVTELERYIDESELKFITGEMDINSDSAWQRHVDALDSIGLPRYLELRQIAYDRQFE